MSVREHTRSPWRTAYEGLLAVTAWQSLGVGGGAGLIVVSLIEAWILKWGGKQ